MVIFRQKKIAKFQKFWIQNEIYTLFFHQSTNFEELRHSHDIFLSSVISNTFVNNKNVNQCLTELLQCCITYCHLVEWQGDHKGPKLEEVSVNFARQSSWLFKLLTSIKSRQTGSQLAQLLLRIDYNRYFSTYGHEIGIRATQI